MRKEKGFTLIELLVVVAIIGILAAIAIPQFSSYRQRGFDARARSDLRNGATAEEAYFASKETYIACTDAGDCKTKLPGFASSNGVVISYSAAAPTVSFTGQSSHPGGSGVTCRWNSANGGDQTCS